MKRTDIARELLLSEGTLETLALGRNTAILVSRIAEEVENGRGVIIVGPPGSGKTVLMYLVADRLAEKHLLMVPRTNDVMPSDIPENAVVMIPDTKAYIDLKQFVLNQVRPLIATARKSILMEIKSNVKWIQNALQEITWNEYLEGTTRPLTRKPPYVVIDIEGTYTPTELEDMLREKLRVNNIAYTDDAIREIIRQGERIPLYTDTVIAWLKSKGIKNLNQKPQWLPGTAVDIIRIQKQVLLMLVRCIEDHC